METVKHTGQIYCDGEDIHLDAETVEEFLDLVVKHYPQDRVMRYAILTHGVDGREILNITREELFSIRRDQMKELGV